MIDAVDIVEKIRSDFGDKSPDVFRLFDEAIAKTNDLNNNRIIRCIIFLSEKNIDKLKASIEAARQDPRDVMLWAEYTNVEESQELIRIRDFNVPFGEDEDGV